MADLNEIVSLLNRELRTSSIPDYPGAMNGLQLANSGKIDQVIAAVDASLPVVQAAAEKGENGLLIVHHGMFWQGAQPLTGAFYQKIRIAMEANLAIYSSHLPLDVHPKWGNNAVLAERIGLREIEPTMEQKGLPIGLKGLWEGSRDDLLKKISSVVQGRVHVCPAGPENIREVVLVTGGAGAEVAAAAATGADAFLTGEGPHWSYPLAEELGFNLFYAGHYATEVFGVQAVSSHLANSLDVPASFIDHPTGL